MEREKFLATNGLDGSGGYLLPEISPTDVARIAKGASFDELYLRELRKRRSNESHFGLAPDVDADDLASAGWGVIFAAADERAEAVREALSPLLEHRRAQAGERYREMIGPDAYRAGESKRDFLKRFRVGAGPADPTKMPYYLLLVGSPEAIPFRFQHQLDVQYAVGRLSFESLDEYAAYARSVVTAESGGLRRRRQAAFFAASNPGDRSTARSADDLVRPLARTTAAGHPGWDVLEFLAEEATKEHLGELVGSADGPAFLFTATHGMGFRRDDSRQLRQNGALVCQDWPGLDKRRPVPIAPDHYFSAEDVVESLRPGGLIAFHFACFGAATPQFDDFAARDFADERREIASRPFLAQLPQRLLGHPRGGALAAVGHVDRAWTWSFSWPGAGQQLGVFQSTLELLLAGHTVGWAMECFSERYAELSSDLAVVLEDLKWKKDVDEFELADLWTSNNDARNYMILGDPAVRLAPEASGPEPDRNVPTAFEWDLSGERPLPRPADDFEGPVSARSYAELEIALHKGPAGSYQVELRFTRPDSESETAPARGRVTFDREELISLELDPKAYGQALSRFLFPQENAHVLRLYVKARAAAEATGGFLRIRLLVAPSAAELHALRWELLHDPESGAPLATSERTLLSRFLVSHDWRPVRLRSRARLKALVAVAAPSDAAEYDLAPVDAEGEIRRARESLHGVTVHVAGEGEPLTVERLFAGLRGGVDVLYLVCHGALQEGRVPYLLLQREDARAARVEGRELAERLGELAEPPRLVVLASCQSAGTEDGTDVHGRATALSSLAPLLAEAGVAAVLAMQGRITMKTVELVMPVFFRELLRDGRIDRALAVARGRIRDRDDAWMPALYLRLKRGRIWYEPGFGPGEGDFDKWDAVVSSLRNKSLTPVLGSGLSRHLYGDDRELARRLAAVADFPLGPEEIEDLPRVAQYYRVSQDAATLRTKVKEVLAATIRERHPEAVAELGDEASLANLVRTVAARLWREEPSTEPHRVLARLPCPVYVTVGRDDLLPRALKEEGKEPEVRICRFQDKASGEEPPTPSIGKPLVFHALGHFMDDASLVLTQDDYFDYLIRVSRDDKHVPKKVDAALLRKSVLFLGFELDDWSFRVLFRRLKSLGGQSLLAENTHVMVQIAPGVEGSIDPERARRYLAQYFPDQQLAKMSIYWGTAAEFLEELGERLEGVPLPSDEDKDDDY